MVWRFVTTPLGDSRAWGELSAESNQISDSETSPYLLARFASHPFKEKHNVNAVAFMR